MDQNTTRRSLMKSLSTGVVGITGAAVVAERASAGYCGGDQYAEASSVTETYTAAHDSQPFPVEKEFAETVRVAVDGPYEMDKTPHQKYYVSVHQLAKTYVKSGVDGRDISAGEGQIDISRQKVNVTYPDESNTRAEWDFPDPDSEPSWLARASNQDMADGYDFHDLAADVAADSFETAVDLFEDTVGTPVAVTVDFADWANDMHSSYQKFQDAKSDTRSWGFDWFYNGETASPASHTFLLFEVSDIPDLKIVDHTVEVESQLPDKETYTHTFNFGLKGAHLCK